MWKTENRITKAAHTMVGAAKKQCVKERRKSRYWKGKKRKRKGEQKMREGPEKFGI